MLDLSKIKPRSIISCVVLSGLAISVFNYNLETIDTSAEAPLTTDNVSVVQEVQVEELEEVQADMSVFTKYENESVIELTEVDVETQEEREKRLKEEESKKVVYINTGSTSTPTDASNFTGGVSAEGVELKYSEPYEYSNPHLTKSSGVCDIYGHHETYYDEKVLPGEGLAIPGRHVADDGTIRDQDGYICVAADGAFYAKGSTLMTSLGPAKVYDCGCAYGTIDIYVNW